MQQRPEAWSTNSPDTVTNQSKCLPHSNTVAAIAVAVAIRVGSSSICLIVTEDQQRAQDKRLDSAALLLKHIGWNPLALIVSSEATLLGQTSRVQKRSHEVRLRI